MTKSGLIGALLAPALAAGPAHELRIDVMPAEAVIVATDSRTKELPDLSFPLSLAASCGESGTLGSVSLNVADVRRFWTADDVAAGIDTALEIPARQLAPVVADFCMLDGEDFAPRLIEAALTAHLALNCAVGDRQYVEYRSFPLDVFVSCDQPETSDEASAGEDSSS